MEAMRGLAALLLICCAADMLLPSGATRGYARFVMGVLIVVAMAGPLAGALNIPDAIAKDVTGRLEEGVSMSVARMDAAQGLDEYRALAVLEGAGIADGGVVISYSEHGVERVTLSGSGGEEAKEAAILGIQAVLSVGEGGVCFE